jgi:hypothetical protein
MEKVNNLLGCEEKGREEYVGARGSVRDDEGKEEVTVVMGKTYKQKDEFGRSERGALVALVERRCVSREERWESEGSSERWGYGGKRSAVIKSGIEGPSLRRGWKGCVIGMRNDNVKAEGETGKAPRM